MTVPRVPRSFGQRRPSGPPPLAPGLARRSRMTVLVRPVELAMIHLMAERNRTTVSDYVRSLSLASVDPALVPQAEAIVRRWAAEDASDAMRSASAGAEP